MDRVYPRQYVYYPNAEYTTYQNQSELFDIAQIGQLFDNEEYLDNLTVNRAESPSIIANDLKKSMNMEFYPVVDRNTYREPNSTETSPGVQTSNDSPYSTCSSSQQNYAYDGYRNDFGNYPMSNSSKRTNCYSPEQKRKIFQSDHQMDNNNNNNNGALKNAYDTVEEEDGLESDDLYLDIKEEKLFNDSFNYNISSTNKNILVSTSNTDLVPNHNNNLTKHNRVFRNISFNNWNEHEWTDIYNINYDKIKPPVFKVEADKGFFYSQFDEAFICQKKNHFQITTHTILDKIPTYCKSKTDSLFHEIDKFVLQLYGIKQESPLQKIQIKQSDSDRKPIDYEPVECKFVPEQPNKLTKMRLHFAHTTNNNNRKRNKAGMTVPNPDQRYFLLIVEIQIVTKSGKLFTLCSSSSERVIVRAVNPGQFKQDTNEDKTLQNSTKLNSNLKQLAEPGDVVDFKPNEHKQVFYGNVGVNTPNPEEALHVIGNIKLTGNILQPSDVRVKENIEPIDTNKALENVAKLKLYKYDFKKEFAEVNGGVVNDFGLLAQNVQEIIPEAVVESGDVVLADGQVVKNFLNVNKNRIHMECVGAVIALDDKTKNLNKKIESIEKIISETNGKVSNENESIQDSKSKSLFNDLYNSTKKSKLDKEKLNDNCCLNKKTFKLIISLSILIIALGIIGILVVQILHHTREPYDFGNNTMHTDDQNRKNDTFFYPKVNPPPIVSPTCNTSTIKCRFCCVDPNSAKAQIDFTKPTNIDVTTAKAVYLGESRLISNLTGATVNAKTALNSALLSVILFSNDPIIYVNLTLSNTCSKPYCEEINGVYYFFIPLSSNVDTKIQFNLAFFLRQGFLMRNCNIQKNGYLCPNTNFDANIFQEQHLSNTTLNGYKDIFNYSKKYIYYAPITYFLHIDFVFRTYMDTNAGLDICSIKQSSLKTVLYKEYVFRFYRLC